MSLPRSWSSTIRSRASAAIGDAELLEDAWRDVDRPRWRRAGSDGDHRDLGVALLERAVAAAAQMVTAAEVRELDTRGGRDDEIAGVGVGQSGPCALERVRLRQQGLLASRLPASAGRGEPKLDAVAPGHRLIFFPEQHYVTLSVEPAREVARRLGAVRKPVRHPRPVGRRHDELRRAAIPAME